MRNVTLSVDDKILAAARRYAADHGTSLNKLIRDYLAAIANRLDKAQDVRQRLRELSDDSQARLGAALPSRDELHERR